MPGPLNYLGKIRINRKFKKALKRARSSRNLLNNLPRSPIRQYVPRRMPMFTPGFTPRTPLTFFSPLPNRRNTPRMFFSPMPNRFLPPQPKKRKGFFGGFLKKKSRKY